MNQTPASSARSASRPSRWRRIVKILLIVLAVKLVLVFVVTVFGHVKGEEFNPHSFRRRSFSYYEFPILHIQLSPVRHLDTTGKLEKHLVSNSLIGKTKPASEKSERWDLVSSNRVDSKSPLCDAAILCRQMDRIEKQSFGQHWLAWSETHTQLAKVFWPVVAKMARQELYIYLPDLMDAARSTKQPAELKAQLDRILGERYQKLAENQQQLEQHKAAVRWYTEAIAIRKNDANLLKGRAKSLNALGKKKEADADLAAARRPSDQER